MFPWFWYWAPAFHYPWSGNVAQHIDPTTQWFFGAIKPSAGNGRIEEKAFAVASYGKQLGLITEVLIDAAARIEPLTPKGQESLTELKRIQAEIERVKEKEYEIQDAQLADVVMRAKRRGGPRYRALAQRLRPLVDAADA